MIFEWDDFGCNHVISDQCQSHDCRDQLDKLHILNPAFRATLFAIPGEMTPELINWCGANNSWISLAVHGFYHTSNYECEKMSYGEFDELMKSFQWLPFVFEKGFRAPGWQISNDIYEWLYDHDWWVADQNYNTPRRPKNLPAYVYDDELKKFMIWDGKAGLNEVKAYHGHTWDVGWNGIYEDFDKIEELVGTTEEFKFVSELFNGH